MAGITSAQATFGKKLDSNTKNLEEWLMLVVNEIRLLRLGDTTTEGGNTL